MTTQGMPARRELAALIKSLRLSQFVQGRPMTQAALGQLIGVSQGTVQKIESVAVRIEPRHVERIIDTVRPDAEVAARLRNLVARNAVGEPWSGERALVPGYARPYMDAELDASEILSWHELRIPGPLQSTHYMLRQFQTPGVVDVAPLLRNREARKRLFHQPQLKRYACILAEEALHKARFSMGRGVILDELDHLLAINSPEDPRELADARTSIHVLPREHGVRHLYGDFSLVLFAEPRHNFVYVEHVVGAVRPKTREALERAQTAWNELAHAALDREHTNELLRRLRGRFAAG